ncbi:hypothetical protein HB839_01500 [Listeria sp. FSL L7-1699]|uniref:Uncharacterized protein n=1 Tax=Listeria farberi TaxID=2713500 RepID=A0ABR6SIW8_9LIST|nr:hypothetical protein [Listeria farberi]MBC1381153.1 hypothetical protein [Listeria farberi]
MVISNKTAKISIDDWVELISESEYENLQLGQIMRVVDVTENGKTAWVRPDYRILSISVNYLRKV